jgi:hypothetical protein
MRAACRPVDASFFESAPWRFRASAELAVAAASAFAIFEDAASWPKWFSSIRDVTWTTRPPFGVGTTRTVRLSTATVYEHFFRWEQGTRFSFYLVGHEAPVPLFRALAEDYVLEPLDAARCRFTYSVAIEPALAMRLTAPISRRVLRRMFEAGPAAFARFLGRGSG